MKRNLLGIATCSLMLAAGLAGAQTTYTWTGATDTVFTTDTNWTPARTVPAANDILVIDGTSTATPTISGLPAAQTIGELHVINAANVTFSAPAASSIITIAGGAAAADVEVTAGSKLTYNANLAVTTTIALQTGAKAQIFGDVVHAGTGNGNANRFTSPDVDGIVFESGSTFQFAPGGTTAGNPFGNANNQSVRFKSGSTAYQGGTTTGPSLGTGSAMQAGTLPANVIVWDAGSTYYNWTSVMAGSGRTYANVTLDNRGAVSNNSGASTLTFNGNLTYKGTAAAAYNYNLTANPGVIVTGDVIVEPAGRMGDTAALVAESRFEVGGNINIAGPNAAMSTNAFRVWTLNGTGTQTITLPATGVVFPTLTVNKASGGVSLGSDIAVTGALTLTSGDITTGAYRVALGTAGTLTGPGKVIGRIGRTVNATTTGARVIPSALADGTALPVTVDITAAGTGTGVIDVEIINAPTQPAPGGHTAINRAWNISQDVAITGITSTLTITYQDADLGSATEANLKLARWNGSSWDVNAGTTIDTIGNTATLTGVTAFSEWTLMEPPAAVSDWTTFMD
jgi:hypothetical protein